MATISEPMTAYHSEHCEQLIERLDTLRSNERFCDVNVEVKGTEFKAHKPVLAAASPFFLTLLESNMRESNEHLIKIELEEATASVMEDVLKYIYTGNVSVTEENAHNLITTADYLLLPGLKSLACDFLKEILATENCVFNYYFAEKYQCMDLKEECRELIDFNFSAVMETDDFLNLDAKQVMEWVSSDDITVRAEEEVFKGIVKWVHHNRSERDIEFPDLFHKIRLNSVHQDYLVNEMVKEELITSNNECLNFVLGSLKWIFSPGVESSIKPRACLQTQRNGIFVCGGNKALFYLPHRNKWYHLPDMMMEHQDHAAIQYRDKVYVFSNQKGNNDNGTADYYMPSTNARGTIQTKFPANFKTFCGTIMLNEHLNLYALLENLHDCAIYVYHSDKSEWNMFIEHNNLKCWGACGVTDRHHLYIIGGTDSDSNAICGRTKVLRFDTVVDNCEEVQAMNEARHDAFGASMNGKIYVAGGLQTNLQICKALDTCEMYDPATNQWQMMPSLIAPCHSSSMVCFQGALYVFGGLKARISRKLSVEMFDFKTNKWKEKSSVPVTKFESKEERRKDLHYKACFATVHKDALEKPIYLSVQKKMSGLSP